MSPYPYRSRSSTSSWWGVVGVVVALIGILIPIILAIVAYNTQHTATVTICSKERVAVDGGGEYRVYAAEGSFVMKDSLIGKVRYSTADAYGRINPNTTYDIVYKGWRIPPASMFPNILEATPVPADRQTPARCD